MQNASFGLTCVKLKFCRKGGTSLFHLHIFTVGTEVIYVDFQEDCMGYPKTIFQRQLS